MNKVDLSIVEKIKNGQYDEVEAFLSHLENRAANEKLKYNQRMIRDRIKSLKQIYTMEITNNHDISADLIKDNLKSDILITKIDTTSFDKNKHIIIDENNIELNVNEGEKATISNIRNITIPFFKSKGSVFIKNCENVTISCFGQQIRINNSKKINLNVYTTSGIQLENSTDIDIYQIKDLSENLKETNQFRNVQDYTNIFDDSNYKVHE